MSDETYVELMRAILLSDPLHGLPREPSRLLSHIYIGSQANAESYKLLQQLGITHVLNCAGFKGPRSSEGSPYEGLNIDYLEFKAEDTEHYDISRHFSEAFGYLDTVRRRGGKALVHCALGINRSGAVCLGYLMHSSKMTLLEATRILKGKRRICVANKGFQKQLVRFARTRGYLDKIERSDESPFHIFKNNNCTHFVDNGRPYRNYEEYIRKPTTKSNSDITRDLPRDLTRDFTRDFTRDSLRYTTRNDPTTKNGPVSNSRMSRRDISERIAAQRQSSRSGVDLSRDISRDLHENIDRLVDSLKISSSTRRPRSQSTSRLPARATTSNGYSLTSSVDPLARYTSQTLGRTRSRNSYSFL